MISSKELQFVSNYANQVPYPGDNYRNLAIDELKKAYDLYQQYYLGKEFCITMSDLQELNFEILPKNLTHMLGVDSNLRKNLIIKKEILRISEYEQITTYDFLNSILENLDKLIKLDKDNNNAFLNYFRIKVKCSIFNKLSNFSEFNFGCINFDRNLYKYVNGEEFFSNATKLLFINSDEETCPYYIVGLKPDAVKYQNEEDEEDKIDNKKNLIVETLLAESNPKKIFALQKTTLPVSILVVDKNNYTEVKATDEEMLQLRNLYAKDIKEYGSILDIGATYFANLSENVKIKRKTK